MEKWVHGGNHLAEEKSQRAESTTVPESRTMLQWLYASMLVPLAPSRVVLDATVAYGAHVSCTSRMLHAISWTWRSELLKFNENEVG